MSKANAPAKPKKCEASLRALRASSVSSVTPSEQSERPREANPQIPYLAPKPKQVKYLLLTAIAGLSLNAAAQSFTNIESVEYDPVNNQWLVSNGSSIIADDGLGNLSFFGNAQASHGMEAVNGILYAIGNNTIRAYDLNDAGLIDSYSVPGSNFLNGMTSDGANRIWVTDFGNGKIHEIDISDPSNLTSTLVATTTGSPNGIVYDEENNRCVFVMWGTNAAIREMSLSDYSLNTLLNTGLGNIDGIDRDSDGRYYISTWSPNRITRYDADLQNPTTIVNTSLSSPADICIDPVQNVIAIPNSGNETVLYIQLATNVEELASDIALDCYPNPASEEFVLSSDGSNRILEIQVINSKGETVHKETNDRPYMKINCASWDKALYLIYVRTSSGERIVRFIKS